MIGQYSHSIDAKGRLFIPARYREELGSTFYVTVGLDDEDNYLSVFSQAAWQAFQEKINSLPFSKSILLRHFCANAADCTPDSQGRILIPQNLRDYAGLRKDVVIVGVLNRCEIWDAEKWQAAEEKNLNPELISQLISELEI